MWIVRLALRRPCTFLVAVLLLLPALASPGRAEKTPGPDYRMAGIITDRTAEAGDTINPGTPILQMVNY